MSKFTASVSVPLANVSLASVPQLRPAERASALVSAMNTDKKLNNIIRSLPANVEGRPEMRIWHVKPHLSAYGGRVVQRKQTGAYPAVGLSSTLFFLQ
ncbi:hypothetical protein PENARI_c034G08066 [Penicillium arizonense]|uniref:Uncharacterized protein n=1 Tax=Penicillium arizonense TaxID=1835702 RepID=A0A1F5L4D0_PENAI|nr:hypothetical protein PENARI_c034G08066 [Penicillium arizonense]OGE47937.1 hypothetical protein PENARI_c034G08066 [Penicillium arizonense]